MTLYTYFKIGALLYNTTIWQHKFEYNNNGNKILIHNNSDITPTNNARFTSSTGRVHLTNVLIENGSLKRTIYCYIWGITFTCSTYYRVMVLGFVCLHIPHYRVWFKLYAKLRVAFKSLLQYSSIEEFGYSIVYI